MNFKFALLGLISLTASSMAHASPTQCLGNIHAFEENAVSALKEAGYRGVSTADLTQTSNDYHDPVFTANVSGQTVTITCDDSGDNDCQCQVSQ